MNPCSFDEAPPYSITPISDLALGFWNLEPFMAPQIHVNLEESLGREDSEESANESAALNLRSSISQFSYSESANLRRSPRKLARVANSEPPTHRATPRKRRAKDAAPGSREGSSSPKKLKTKRGYATPETYAHLGLLQDYLERHLDVMFCGIK
ncbi:hypothetical protein OE88DRAFT_400417 [Heliocybe sulcata]|uniref:Uncharacterized protein n=1 Tax=Heliocybe sulcata TaxID=5364 RepID=A0A5C3MWL0_9AGAM|nr:hypothetical protein OE88DRAFT_400417 [Heliocybe sulcata]